MWMLRQGICLSLLGIVAVGLLACSTVNGVPKDADLIWAGVCASPDKMVGLDPGDVPGEVYIYDDTAKQLAAVRPARSDALDYQWIVGHQYHVFFRPNQED
ncbi:MAG: hypothetical protein ABSG31_10035 [Tepidisphaeraceae bacterium]|jgi:hypothetical protein